MRNDLRYLRLSYLQRNKLSQVYEKRNGINMKNKDHVSINEKFPRRIDIHKILGIDHTYCTYYNTYFIFSIQHPDYYYRVKNNSKNKIKKSPKRETFFKHL